MKTKKKVKPDNLLEIKPGFSGKSQILSEAICAVIDKFPDMTVSEIIGTLFMIILDLWHITPDVSETRPLNQG